MTKAASTKLLLILTLGLIGPSLLISADKKWWEETPFQEWSEKQVQSMLTKSPWTRTYTYSPPSLGSAARPGGDPAGRSVAGRAGRPSNNQERPPSVRFRVHWFSARPTRMALGKRALQLNPNLKMEQITRFATSPSQDAVVSITIDSNEAGKRHARALGAVFRRLDLAAAIESTQLTTKGGKKIPLADFRPDAQDGTGAKFIFARTLQDGRPILEAGDREARFRFVTKISQGRETLRLDVRFKIKDMIYKREIEY